MATRSALLNLASGQMVYVHWDGSPETRLPILREGYADPVSANALFARCANTDVSELASTLAESVFYDQRGEDGCVFDKVEPANVANALGVLQNSDCEYLYAWDGVRWDWAKVVQNWAAAQ